MQYRETPSRALPHREDYLAGIERIISERQATAQREREARFRRFPEKQESLREEFRAMLGWPLVDKTDTAPPRVTVTPLSDENGYSIERLSFEILDGLFMSGILLRHHGDAPRPLVIAQHGGLGSSEVVTGVLGHTDNYNDMGPCILRHGAHVFAPQLLLWHDEFYGPKKDRVRTDARLKRLGSSITALEIYGITRILDYFERETYVSAFGMIGLSYGGFYTLFTAAADTRIRSAISCSQFSTRDAYPWTDWTWFDSARFDDAEIACLVYPRRLCLQVGRQDELFDYREAERSFARIESLCKETGTDWVELTVFEGAHELCRDDAPIARMIADLLA